MHNGALGLLSDTPLRIGYAIGSWSNFMFDDDRDFYIQHSKVIINIHTEEGSALELHRVNYLLSLGKCVISERSDVSVELENAYAYPYQGNIDNTTTTRNNTNGTDSSAGGVVFVEEYTDIIDILYDLTKSREYLRRDIEKQVSYCMSPLVYAVSFLITYCGYCVSVIIGFSLLSHILIPPIACHGAGNYFYILCRQS